MDGTPLLVTLTHSSGRRGPSPSRECPIVPRKPPFSSSLHGCELAFRAIVAFEHALDPARTRTHTPPPDTRPLTPFPCKVFRTSFGPQRTVPLSPGQSPLSPSKLSLFPTPAASLHSSLLSSPLHIYIYTYSYLLRQWLVKATL